MPQLFDAAASRRRRDVTPAQRAPCDLAIDNSYFVKTCTY